MAGRGNVGVQRAAVLAALLALFSRTRRAVMRSHIVRALQGPQIGSWSVWWHLHRLSASGAIRFRRVDGRSLAYLPKRRRVQ